MTKSTEILELDIQLSGNGQTLERQISEAVKESENDLSPLFERMISHEDSRTTIVDGLMEIEQVTIQDSWVCVEATFQTSFYAGCKDINSEDTHPVSLEFELINGDLKMVQELPPEWSVWE